MWWTEYYHKNNVASSRDCTYSHIVTTRTTHNNLSDADTDLEEKIESQSKDIDYLNQKLNNQTGEK